MRRREPYRGWRPGEHVLAPHVLDGSRDGQRMGEWKMKDVMINDGLWCAFNNYHMGITAENIVDKYELSRTEQDAFAATSQQRAEAAKSGGWFDDEIVAVEIPQRVRVIRSSTSRTST